MLTDLEFENRISEIDREQREEKIPIYARPLNAVHRYAIKYKVQIMLGGFQLFKSDDKFDSLNLTQTISDWYDKKYGNRLKKDFSKGYVALLIAGSIYKMKIPLIFGKSLICADGKFKLNQNAVQDGTMLLNVITFIEDLTRDLSSELSPEEENNILQVYGFASELFELLSKGSNRDSLCESAKEDLKYAVDSLLHNHLNVGHSKWASLQATEKILKSILQRRKISYKNTHNLRKLISSLQKIGFPEVSDDLIDAIQCKASIRYGDIPYSIEDAIKAHHYSIYLCKEYLKLCV
ncbi:MAG: HEPN domain-containing protein [Ignavibacteria bacterium]|jgi:HEPN domain-containing protein